MVTRGDINGGNISLSFFLPSLVISFFRSKLYLRKKSVESWRKKTSHKRGLGLKIREGGGGGMEEAGLLYNNFGPCQWSHYYLGQIYHLNEVLYETPQETCFY